MKVTIRFFGAFRGVLRNASGTPDSPASEAPLEIALAPNATVADLRLTLAGRLESAEAGRLLGDSAFADEKRVLRETDVVTPGATIAVLPPVCGG